MRIGVVVNKEDKRVAITPETTRKFLSAGFEVILPHGYGESANFPDKDYSDAGATLCSDHAKADIYVCVSPPSNEIELPAGSYLIGQLNLKKDRIASLYERGITCCALERIPRITRAQSMDILSSQANIVGYCAVLVALEHYEKIFPLMMTAAGTIRPARVLILGAGVAGLQAIATAKRMGAIVSAYDVRSVTKEQVESLGARFIEVSNDCDGEGSGGYAKEMSDEYKKRQHEVLSDVISQHDIVITTANVPNGASPRLITKDMVEKMPAGSVIVDTAAANGGNCEVSENGKIIKWSGVTIIGFSNLAEKVAYDASQLFARNIFNFIKLMVKDDSIVLSDEIVQATIVKEIQ